MSDPINDYYQMHLARVKAQYPELTTYEALNIVMQMSIIDELSSVSSRVSNVEDAVRDVKAIVSDRM